MLDFEVRCPTCGTDVSRGAPCRICNDGGRCCPCVHDDEETCSGCGNSLAESDPRYGCRYCPKED